MQRIWATWEAIAAPFLLDTPLINVVYILLGARVSKTPTLDTRNSKPETRNPKLETLNSKPETLNPKPETRNTEP